MAYPDGTKSARWFTATDNPAAPLSLDLLDLGIRYQISSTNDIPTDYIGVRFPGFEEVTRVIRADRVIINWPYQDRSNFVGTPDSWTEDYGGLVGRDYESIYDWYIEHPIQFFGPEGEIIEDTNLGKALGAVWSGFPQIALVSLTVFTNDSRFREVQVGEYRGGVWVPFSNRAYFSSFFGSTATSTLGLIDLGPAADPTAFWQAFLRSREVL